MKNLTEDAYSDLVTKKKIDLRGTRIARIAQPSEEENSYDDHPLVEQSRAIMKMADSISESLQGQDSDTAKAVQNLVAAMSNHNDMLMNIFSRQHAETMKMMEQMMAEKPEKKRLPWKLKVNRDRDGFMDTVDIFPVENKIG